MSRSNFSYFVPLRTFIMIIMDPPYSCKANLEMLERLFKTFDFFNWLAEEPSKIHWMTRVMRREDRELTKTMNRTLARSELVLSDLRAICSAAICANLAWTKLAHLLQTSIYQARLPMVWWQTTN